MTSTQNELATIVHPSILRKCIRDAADRKRKKFKRAGRPRTAEQIEKLILKLAKDTGWGYCRILGELRELGIESVTRNTVKNILKRNGLMHDNDGKYSEPFHDAIKKAKIKPHRTAIRSTNMVAYVERFVQTIKQEVLNDFIVFGHKHMDYLCGQFRIHYLEERPHQGLNNELIENPDSKKRKKSTMSTSQSDTIRLSDIRCQERLG